jgi:hypothetical protein
VPRCSSFIDDINSCLWGRLDEIKEMQQNGAAGIKDMFHSKTKVVQLPFSSSTEFFFGRSTWLQFATLNLSANQLQVRVRLLR